MKSIFICVLTMCFCCTSQASVPTAEEDGGFTTTARVKSVTQDRAREVFEAFQKAYPGRFGKIETINDDLTITLDGVRFYWAEGKILPEEDLPDKDDYSRQSIYRYPKTLAPVPEYTPEMKKEMDEWVKQLDDVPVSRHSGIFTRLWRVHNAYTADHCGRTIRFLGRGVRVHMDLVPVLRRIEKELRNRARKDRELARFLRTIRSVSGLYWRKIARTKTLSFHSFGAAVDIVSSNPRRKETYWLWAKARDKEWYTRPLSRRHMPPVSFVKVFEKHGFVWGGKWLFYDTIHFEYRPDILLLNGFTPEAHPLPTPPQ